MTSKFDRHRPWKKLYDTSRWRNVVQPAVLRRDPVCTVCKRRPSTIADHIRDHRGDVTLFYDLSNLRGACAPCHDKKTGTEHGIGRVAPIKTTDVPDPDGVPAGVDFTALLNLDPNKKKG